MTKHNWSVYQKAIFVDIAKGSGNTIIIARAGSSKTTSLVEGCKYLPRGKSALFCAFNKSIQEELKERLGDYVYCSTLHSLGWRSIKSRFPNIELDRDKTAKIVESIIGNGKDKIDLNFNICKAVSLCKSTLTDIPSKIDDLLDEYDIDTCLLERETFISHICKTLRRCKEDTLSADFDDMVWFCFVYGITPSKYDCVFVDEAQDMNKAMIELALSACKKNGRVICVLDDRQAIYRFRGADSEVLDNLKNRLNPKELMLPISYRCPKKVIYHVQKIVPDIKPYEESPDGEIIHINNKDLQKYASPGCFILSRTNAPLISTCMKFIKQGIRANILGRDIGDGLSWMIKKSKRKTVDGFLTWLDKWAEAENKALEKKGKSNGYVVDKVECLQNLCEGAKNIEEVLQNIKDIFDDVDDKNIILFSSIHKSKGLEREEVFVLYDTIRRDSIEEKNLEYVACTRAKRKLYMVSKNN